MFTLSACFCWNFMGGDTEYRLLRVKQYMS